MTGQVPGQHRTETDPVLKGPQVKRLHTAGRKAGIPQATQEEWAGVTSVGFRSYQPGAMAGSSIEKPQAVA
jgi:hypothetical protein